MCNKSLGLHYPTIPTFLFFPCANFELRLCIIYCVYICLYFIGVLYLSPDSYYKLLHHRNDSSGKIATMADATKDLKICIIGAGEHNFYPELNPSFADAYLQVWVV